MRVRRVLICRVGAMGDVLHALPAVAALRRERPDWRIGWAVDPRWAPLLACLDEDQRPGIEAAGLALDRLHLVETKLWSKAPFSVATLQSVLRLRKSLRDRRYDIAVDMQGTLRSAVIARMAAARTRAGYSDPREALAASFYTHRLQRQGIHVVQQGADLLGKAVGIALEPREVELPHAIWADSWAAELAKERRICVLGPGAGWAAKRWPAEKFGALAKKLRALGLVVLVNAPQKDDPPATEVVAASEGAAERVVCNVAGLTALLRRTALFVGGDSGPMHLAAALSVPLVGLFGPTDPARNGPWGPGPKLVLRNAASVTTYKRSNEIEAGLAGIEVEAVLAAARHLI